MSVVFSFCYGNENNGQLDKLLVQPRPEHQCDSTYIDTSENYQEGAKIKWIQEHCKYKNKTYTIRFQSFWPSMQKHRETYFDQKFPFNRLYYESFYQSGRKNVEMTFKNGILEGKVKKYWENGSIQYSKVYSNGLIQTLETYDSIGKKSNEVSYKSPVVKYLLDSINSFVVYQQYKDINYYSEHHINDIDEKRSSYAEFSKSILGITKSINNFPDPSDIKNPIQTIAYISILENRLENKAITKNELKTLLEYLLIIDHPSGYYYGIIYDYLKNHSPYRTYFEPAGLYYFNTYMWFKDKLIPMLPTDVTAPVLITKFNDLLWSNQESLSYFAKAYINTKYEEEFVSKYTNYLSYFETCIEDEECSGVRSKYHKQELDSLRKAYPSIKVPDYSSQYCRCTDP